MYYKYKYVYMLVWIYEREKQAAIVKQCNYHCIYVPSIHIYVYVYIFIKVCVYWTRTPTSLFFFVSHTFIIQFMIFMAFQFMFYDCFYAVVGELLVKTPVSMLNNMLQTLLKAA